jgi:hypothetical protein
VIDATQPATTACGPSADPVGRCNSRVETTVPSCHTPPTFDVVAPPSVPMYTCRSADMLSPTPHRRIHARPPTGSYCEAAR